MKFPWRKSEQNPAEKIASFQGVLEDLDKTPVAMFALVSGKEFGLTMEDLGELVENHNELLFHGGAMPPEERNVIARERQLAYDGAFALSRQFNLLLDDRLRPYEAPKERQPGPAQANEYAQLMQRLAVRSLKRE